MLHAPRRCYNAYFKKRQLLQIPPIIFVGSFIAVAMALIVTANWKCDEIHAVGTLFRQIKTRVGLNKLDASGIFQDED